MYCSFMQLILVDPQKEKKIAKLINKITCIFFRFYLLFFLLNLKKETEKFHVKTTYVPKNNFTFNDALN